MTIKHANMKQKPHHSRSQRSGMSLVETVIMMGISSTMLIVATGWIHQTMKQSMRFRVEHRKQLALTQLSQHFRKQVWSSSDAKVSETNSVSLTDSQGNRSDYSVSDRGIEFVQRDSSGEVASMEPFVLPPETRVNFDTSEQSEVILKVEELVPEAADAKGSRTPEWRTTLMIKPTTSRWLKRSSSSTSEPLGKPANEGEESPE